MNAKELANKIVAFGVGEHCGEWFGIMAFDTALEGEILDPHDAEHFVLDGRVVIALMEKCLFPGPSFDIDLCMAEPGESLHLTITEACVAALEGQTDE